MDYRETDTQELTERIAALLEEYGWIEFSLPGGKRILLTEAEKPLLQIRLGHKATY
jgi:hypothetical protein